MNIFYNDIWVSLHFRSLLFRVFTRFLESQTNKQNKQNIHGKEMRKNAAWKKREDNVIMPQFSLHHDEMLYTYLHAAWWQYVLMEKRGKKTYCIQL